MPKDWECRPKIGSELILVCVNIHMANETEPNDIDDVMGSPIKRIRFEGMKSIRGWPSERWGNNNLGIFALIWFEKKEHYERFCTRLLSWSTTCLWTKSDAERKSGQRRLDLVLAPTSPGRNFQVGTYSNSQAQHSNARAIHSNPWAKDNNSNPRAIREINSILVE